MTILNFDEDAAVVVVVVSPAPAAGDPGRDDVFEDGCAGLALPALARGLEARTIVDGLPDEG